MNRFKIICQSALIVTVALVLFEESPCYADYVISQVKQDKNFAVLKTTASETTANGTLIQLEKGGQTCSLKVYSVKGPWVAATPESCSNFSELQPGDEFSEGSISASPNEESPTTLPDAEPTPTDSETPKEETQQELKEEPKEQVEETPKAEKSSNRRGRTIRTKAAELKDFHLGLNLYYSLAKNPGLKYTSTTTVTGVAPVVSTIEGAYTAGGAPGLGLRLMYLPLAETPSDSDEFKLGGSLSYNYDLSRKVTAFTLSTGAVTTLTNLTFQFSNLELNLMGGYGGWIFFAGPNYSALSVGGSDKDPDINYLGAIGFQGGVGYLISNFGFELGYRTLSAKIGSGIVETEFTAQTFKLSGLFLRGIVYFSL